MTTAQDVVTEDVAGMRACQANINDASSVVAASKLTPAEKSAVHASLAKASGDLNGPLKDSNAWLKANPAPSPAPPTPTPPAPAPPAPTPPSTYPVPNAPVSVVAEPVFDDDFLGTALNTANWAPDWFGSSGKMNNVTTSPNNVSVANSICTLKLSSASVGGLISSNPSGGAKTGFQFGDGYYIEWLASLSLEAWCALWTDGQSWPAGGEIDIAEILGGKPTSNYHSNAGANNGPAESTSYGSGFHTFGVERLAGTNNIYWDGKLIRTYSTDDGGALQYLIANIGESSGESTVGSVAEIDRVTVWKLA